MYGRIYRVVEPKRARMNAAMAQLAEKQAAQAEAQARLREVRLRPVGRDPGMGLGCWGPLVSAAPTGMESR